MEPHPIHYNYPMRFPKINTLFMRDMTRTVKRKGLIMPGMFSEEAFGAIKFWRASEKIHGENIRIFIDFIPGNLELPHVWIGGRNDTDNPEINEDLLHYIKTRVNIESLRKAFTKGSFGTDECPRYAMIFGEGYGGDIKHGHNYRETPELIVFDIVIDNWFLEYDNVADISKKLGLQSVPILPEVKTVEEIVEYVKAQPKSIIANKPHVMEGLVCTSAPLLLTRNGFSIKFKLKTKDFRDLDSYILEKGK